MLISFEVNFQFVCCSPLFELDIFFWVQVRVYTAKNIFQELKLAKAEFIQTSVHIHKEAKIFLPKILCYFAKDTSIDMYALLKSISGCLTEAQRRAVSKCMKRKVDKHIHWIPQSSTFRYVIRGEFAKGG